MKHNTKNSVQKVSWNSAVMFSFTGVSAAFVALVIDSTIPSFLLAGSVIATALALLVYSPTYR